MFKNGSITKNSDLYGLCVDDIERAKALLEIKLADPLISMPGQDKPAVVGKTVNQKLNYGQNITQYAPTANMVVNGTNDNHIFNDGYVVRTINVDTSGNVTIITKGEGVNETLLKIVPAAIVAEFNTSQGISMFEELGMKNHKAITEKLKNCFYENF